MGWDNACIGVGMGLGYVFGNNSSSINNQPEMWGLDGIMLALWLAWGWDMCLVTVVVIKISLRCKILEPKWGL